MAGNLRLRRNEYIRARITTLEAIFRVVSNEPTYASEQELAELREEVRRLKAEREQSEPASNGQGTAKQENAGQEGEEQKEKKPHPLRKIIIICIAVIVAGTALIWWLHERHYESTDDAAIDGHISGISSRIAGTVTAVYVEENQFVKAGETVVELDPRDYKAALAEAQGQLRQAQGQLVAERPNIPVTEVTNQTDISTSQSMITGAEAGVASADRNYEAAVERVREAQANNAKAQADVERYTPLVDKDEISRQQFDQVVAAAKAMAATVDANQATARAALSQVDVSRAQLAQARLRAQQAEKNAPREMAIRQADVGSRQGAAAMAEAQLEQAKLNLSYCRIVTPVDGIVAKRNAEVGMRVASGDQVLLITQLNDLWVTANFRETQLRHMRPGQSVRVHVDALGTYYDAYIESMPAASGAVTSLLPPENATGNFVKVVQRLPVRIRFKSGQNGLDRLRPGMSVEPKVRIE